MQRFASIIDGNSCLLAVNRYPNGYIRALRLDIGTFASRLAQTVAYGILHLQSRKLSVAQSIIGATCRNGNSGTVTNHRCPRQCLYALIERLGTISLNATHDAQNTRSNTRPQTRTITIHLRSEERDTTLQGAHALSTQTLQLIGQDMLKPLRACSEEFKLIVCHRGSFVIGDGC